MRFLRCQYMRIVAEVYRADFSFNSKRRILIFAAFYAYSSMLFVESWLGAYLLNKTACTLFSYVNITQLCPILKT